MKTNQKFRKAQSEKVSLNVQICMKMIEFYDIRMGRVGTIFSQRFNHLKLINELKKIK